MNEKDIQYVLGKHLFLNYDFIYENIEYKPVR